MKKRILGLAMAASVTMLTSCGDPEQNSNDSVFQNSLIKLNFPYFRQAANLIIRFSHKALLFFCRFVSFLQTRSLLYRSTSNFLA